MIGSSGTYKKLMYLKPFLNEINQLRALNKLKAWDVNELPKYENGIDFWTFNSTEYENIRTLLPNNILNINHPWGHNYYQSGNIDLIRRVSLNLLDEFNYELNKNSVEIESFTSDKYLEPYKLNMTEFETCDNIIVLQRDYEQFIKVFYYLELSNALLSWNMNYIGYKHMIINNDKTTLNHLENYHLYLQIYKQDLFKNFSYFKFGIVFLL